MPAKLALREYQTDTINAFDEEFDAGLFRVATVLPTGMGKTVIFAEMIRRALTAGRVPIVLVHREELAQQAADKIRAVDPSITVGIVKAARNELTADVLVCSVPTLAVLGRIEKLLAQLGERKRFVVVDECHHAAARTWLDVLRGLGSFHDTPTAGFTATMSREDSRKLGDVWQTVVPKVRHDILFGIRRGFLTDVRGKRVTVDDFDLASVAKTRGDYQEGALGKALIASGAGEIIAESYIEHAKGRPGVLFAPTVETAHVFAEDLNAAGIRTGVITGSTPNDGPGGRLDLFEQHRTGKLDVLSNCMVLTEGWDAPHTSCAIIARPTSSAALYVQMVGRVLRPFPGKTDALVLDVVGVTGMHALRSLIDLSTSAVPMLDEESLLEAIARKEAEDEALEAGKPADAARAAGLLAATDVDLFHGSSSVWLQTYAGIWFIPTRQWTYFLWPENGTGMWKIGRKPTWQNRGARGGWVREEGLDIGYAMAVGEAEAGDADPSVAKKSASWRRKSNPPSDPQIAQCARFGLTIPEGANRSEVSDMISVHFASRDLDPKNRPTKGAK